METLKVIKSSVTAMRMSTHYNRTFVCRNYPGTALSKNTVCSLLRRLGQDGPKRKMFYQRHLAQVAKDHHIAIDSALKQDTSRVNDLSDFFYKAQVKGCRDVSVLYAYDIELMEPVWAEVFSGNSIDASPYPDFTHDNDIRKGIIVADKGFSPSKIKGELRERPELHFLIPIKRNDSRISENDMLSFKGVLTGIDVHVLLIKKQIKGGRCLYSFKDVRKASIEESDYLARAKASKNFDTPKYEKKHSVFGLLVLESDQDLDPETAYLCYDDRWILELVFNRYENDECLDRTNVQGDFSALGNEFVNYISTVAICRIIRRARRCGLLEKMSYGDLMDDISSAWRRTVAPLEPRSDDGC